MLLVLSRPTNPNWQGRKAWGPPSSPVKQAFQRSPGKSRALQEQPPFPSWCGQYYNSPASLCCLNTNTEGRHQKPHCPHTPFQTRSRGCHIPIQWPFGNPGCLNIAGLSCTFSWFETTETRSVGTPSLSVPLVPS